MNTKIFGYARVSSKEQNEEQQLVIFKEFGINDRDIYIDKQSGKDFDRKQFIILKKYMGKIMFRMLMTPYLIIKVIILKL